MSFKLPTQWTNNTDAIGKDLNLVDKSNASITSNLNMNSNKITKLPNPLSDTEPVTRKFTYDNFLKVKGLQYKVH